MMNNPAYENILTRCSVRKYEQGRLVSPEMQEAILRAAMSAPSGVNRQPWEFVVVTSPELLTALAGALPYAKMTAGAPMAIVVCGNHDRFLDGDDSVLWTEDLSAASENILLAAHAFGLGSVWTALYPHPDRMKAVSDILGLPEKIEPFSLLPVGWPADSHKPVDKWHPDRVHYNGY